jgi:WD40 repeat protein
MTGSFNDYDRLRLWEAAHQRRDELEELGRWVYTGDRVSDGGTVAGTGGALGLRDVRSDAEHAAQECHTGDVTACAISPDGSRIVSGSLDGTIKLWDAKAGRCLATLAERGGGVLACAFSPDGRRFVSAGADHTLKLRDSETGRCKAILEGHGGWVWACAFSPDGKKTVSASGDETSRLQDAHTGAWSVLPLSPWERRARYVAQTRSVWSSRH